MDFAMTLTLNLFQLSINDRALGTAGMTSVWFKVMAIHYSVWSTLGCS